VSVKDVLKDYELRLATERAFHISIQNMIDIGSHLLASLNINDVQTYADIPFRLQEANIISRKLSKNMCQMAKLRNILVHEYIKLETAKLVSYLKHNLSDFEDFSKAIIKYLSNHLSY
jgi:uncharacterized protein YutE (UPF0331/DUF86 family)